MQVPSVFSGFQSSVQSAGKSGAQSSLASLRGGFADGKQDHRSDKELEKPGSLAGLEVSSSFVAIEKSKIDALASAQRADSDVRLSDEGKQRSLAAISKERSSENVSPSVTSADHEKLQLTTEIRQLSQRDREVRNHERIHASIAGAHGGTPSFQFQRGPNGVLYAVSGSVSIDLSVVPGNAEATIRKAEQIERAALGPSDPSGADRAVAAKARSLANQARAELAKDNEVPSEKVPGEVDPDIDSEIISARDPKGLYDNGNSGAREGSTISILDGAA